MKRLFDILLVLLVLPVWISVVIMVSIIVKINMGSPIFFRQLRGGREGKPFLLIKFRTMNEQTDEHGNLLQDCERLTKFGIWLRSTSLDEIPELLNVIKGDMSLVGPRPLPMKYIKRYSDYQRRRLGIEPGLTGWAQIQGRNTLSWAKRFQLDVWYIENRSLWLDIKILYLTLWKVLRKEGVTAEGEATMTEFMGSDKDI